MRSSHGSCGVLLLRRQARLAISCLVEVVVLASCEVWQHTSSTLSNVSFRRSSRGIRIRVDHVRVSRLGEKRVLTAS